LKFDLAAKLIWKGGDNVYDAGKKDIATLYEYWLFFTLLDLLKEVFEIEPKSIAELIQYDKGQLSLNLKQGTAIAMKGVYKSPSRNLNIQFSYNRSFGGGKTFPDSGSYTTTLRPDYTLSIWPEEIKEARDAEIAELITHIHFDAKYKVKNFYELISKSKDEELTEEENIELIKEEIEEVKKGTFKNQDLLKMHAYKDAIRRTGGAYVLYPGEGKDEPFRGFHELIPGLGAFVIKPNKDDEDKEHLKTFIKKVIANFINRASQREYTAIKIHDIHKVKKDDSNILNEAMPEYLDLAKKEKLIPDETFVLVGYCKNNLNVDWYKKEGKYNFRMDDDKGSLSLETNVVNAKYLLLRESGKETANKIFKIVSKGPKVYKGAILVENGYKTNNLKDYYLVIEIEKEESKDFKGVGFNFKELEKYKEIKSKNNHVTAAGIPFAVTLTELMKEKIK
jgi:DNA-binding transcriptional regulator YhcF (GntR family)